MTVVLLKKVQKEMGVIFKNFQKSLCFKTEPPQNIFIWK